METEAKPDINDLIPASNRAGISYRVILDQIDSRRETVDSFCIKLSIFIKTPVTRIKFITKKLPTILCKFDSKRRARKLLELVQEAGGVAHIEEVAKTVEVKAEEKDKSVCPSCGFPISEEDKYCPFCMTSLKESKRETPERFSSGKKDEYLIPPYRVLFYIMVLILAVILKVAL